MLFYSEKRSRIWPFFAFLCEIFKIVIYQVKLRVDFLDLFLKNVLNFQKLSLFVKVYFVKFREFYTLVCLVKVSPNKIPRINQIINIFYIFIHKSSSRKISQIFDLVKFSPNKILRINVCAINEIYFSQVQWNILLLWSYALYNTSS